MNFRPTGGEGRNSRHAIISLFSNFICTHIYMYSICIYSTCIYDYTWRLSISKIMVPEMTIGRMPPNNDKLYLTACDWWK